MVAGRYSLERWDRFVTNNRSVLEALVEKHRQNRQRKRGKQKEEVVNWLRQRGFMTTAEALGKGVDLARLRDAFFADVMVSQVVAFDRWRDGKLGPPRPIVYVPEEAVIETPRSGEVSVFVLGDYLFEERTGKRRSGSTSGGQAFVGFAADPQLRIGARVVIKNSARALDAWRRVLGVGPPRGSTGGRLWREVRRAALTREGWEVVGATARRATVSIFIRDNGLVADVGDTSVTIANEESLRLWSADDMLALLEETWTPDTRGRALEAVAFVMGDHRPPGKLSQLPVSARVAIAQRLVNAPVVSVNLTDEYEGSRPPLLQKALTRLRGFFPEGRVETLTRDVEVMSETLYSRVEEDPDIEDAFDAEDVEQAIAQLEEGWLESVGAIQFRASVVTHEFYGIAETGEEYVLALMGDRVRRLWVDADELEEALDVEDEPRLDGKWGLSIRPAPSVVWHRYGDEPVTFEGHLLPLSDEATYAANAELFQRYTEEWDAIQETGRLLRRMPRVLEHVRGRLSAAWTLLDDDRCQDRARDVGSAALIQSAIRFEQQRRRVGGGQLDLCELERMSTRALIDALDCAEGQTSLLTGRQVPLAQRGAVISRGVRTGAWTPPPRVTPHGGTARVDPTELSWVIGHLSRVEVPVTVTIDDESLWIAGSDVSESGYPAWRLLFRVPATVEGETALPAQTIRLDAATAVTGDVTIARDSVTINNAPLASEGGSVGLPNVSARWVRQVDRVGLEELQRILTPWVSPSAGVAVVVGGDAATTDPHMEPGHWNSDQRRLVDERALDSESRLLEVYENVGDSPGPQFQIVRSDAFPGRATSSYEDRLEAVWDTQTAATWYLDARAKGHSPEEARMVVMRVDPETSPEAYLAAGSTDGPTIALRTQYIPTDLPQSLHIACELFAPIDGNDRLVWAGDGERVQALMGSFHGVQWWGWSLSHETPVRHDLTWSPIGHQLSAASLLESLRAIDIEVSDHARCRLRIPLVVQVEATRLVLQSSSARKVLDGDKGRHAVTGDVVVDASEFARAVDIVADDGEIRVQVSVTGDVVIIAERESFAVDGVVLVVKGRWVRL